MSDAEAQDQPIVWTPDPAQVEASNLTAFMRQVGVEDFNALVKLADRDLERFWGELIRYSGLRFVRSYDQLVDVANGIEWAEWFIGGRGNIVLNCLDRHIRAGHGGEQAIDWEGETGQRRAWSYAELAAETAKLAGGLQSLGIGPGDAVGLYMPMCPEIVAAWMAIAKIGAIIVPLYSGFGAPAIRTRLEDSDAKAIVSVDATLRRGKMVAMKPVADEALDGLPGNPRHIVLKLSGHPVSWNESRDLWWHDLVADRPETLKTVDVEADAPLMLIYTSGTTGKPKGTVHTHYGFALKLVQDMSLCFDFKAGDRLLWMSDMGWLVGPILVAGCTLLRGTILLAEGTPDYPQPGRIWRLAQDFKATHLGIAPTIARALMRHDLAEVNRYDLSGLKVTISTGEPWNRDSWLWFFDNICKRKVPLLNYSGGTEVGGGILCGTVLHPLKPCALGGPIPGMGADVVDDRGRSLGPGQVGELVLRRPSPGLTRGLWRDRARYLESYWEKIPGLWVHGDFASTDKDGMLYVHGRSDDTIKVAGKRIGPAEIETMLLESGLLAEAAVVGVPDPIKGQAVVCACVALPAHPPSPELVEALSQAVQKGAGVAFKPREILFVPDLPKTRNMKIMRRVVRAAYTGDATGDLSAIVNPESIEAMRAVFVKETRPL